MLLALGALAAALAGCVHASALADRAAFDLDCTPARVALSEADGGYRARGCGGAALYDCRVVKMESRCRSAEKVPRAPADADPPGGATPRGAAINRAVVDLSCPEDLLTARAFGSGGIGVRGCGRRVAYVCHQRFWRYHCEVDSAIRIDRGP